MEEFKSEVLALEYKLKNHNNLGEEINQAYDISRLKLWNTNVANNDYY